LPFFIGTRAELIGMASFLKEVDKNPDTELVSLIPDNILTAKCMRTLLKDLGSSRPRLWPVAWQHELSKQISALINQNDDIFG